MRSPAVYLLTTLLIAGCSKTAEYKVKDYVLIQPNGQKPLGGVVVGYERRTDGLYYKVRQEDGEIAAFPSSQVEKTVKTIGDITHAQYEWEDQQTPEYTQKVATERTAKSLIFLCGVLPLILLVLANLNDFFALPLIVYIGIALLVNSTVFLSVMLLFALLSSIYLVFARVLLGDVGAYVSYAVFLLMMLF